MAAPLPVGAVLDGRFVLSEIIGCGTTGTVYRAIDRRPRHGETELAVKVGGEAVRDEARVLRALDHPNVVRAHGAGRCGDLHFLVLDLLPGMTLTQILSDRAGRGIHRDRVLRIVADLGRALASLHRLGWIHGDVKPGNVMVGPDDRAVLIDFAAARPFRPIPAGTSPGSSSPTSGSDLTPAYASPARLAGHPPDPRDDVFSLAVLAFTLFAGHHPCAGRPVTEALRQGTWPMPPAGLGGAVWAALCRGLAPAAEVRPADAARFAARLRRPGVADHIQAWRAATVFRAGLPQAASPLRGIFSQLTGG